MANKCSKCDSEDSVQRFFLPDNKLQFCRPCWEELRSRIVSAREKVVKQFIDPQPYKYDLQT